MKLIIAEKKSVGETIAKVLGLTEKCDGCIKGGEFIVSWCVGHLVGLALPDGYGEQYENFWTFDNLPIIPGEWKFVTDSGKVKQLKILKNLMFDSSVDELICATDAGREGECIFRYVYNYLGCRKPVKRLWISSMEDSAIREGMNNLQPDSNFDNLFAAGLCRAKADWLVGMNASRLFSNRYKAVLNIGRVQTPVLAMVVQRDYDIAHFVKQKFYNVTLNCGDFSVISERFDDESKALEIAKTCGGKTATVTDVTKEIKTVNPPKSCDWVHTKENADGLKINSYFADNPDMVLGKLSDNGRFGSIICTPFEGADLKAQLHEAMKNIKGEYIPLEFQQELDERAEDKYLTATPDIENLTYTVVEDKLYYRVDDNLIPLKESEQHGIIADRRKAMCGLGETVRELLQAQVEDRPDKEIKSLQAELTVKYDNFVKKYGRINPIETPNSRNASGVSRKAPNSNVFKNDVRLPLLQSLEKMQDGQFIGKTEIFTERTIRPHKVAEHVETAHEALILSMSEKGRIDFDYMEQLTGFEKNKIIDDLHGDIFPVPELSTEDNTVYQTSDEYLSGNIYKKIVQAEAKMILSISLDTFSTQNPKLLGNQLSEMEQISMERSGMDICSISGAARSGG